MGMGRSRQTSFNWAGLGCRGELPIGGKASWGWAAAKGAAKARCGLVHVEQCTLNV